jgi:hypothetical protein
MVEASKKSGFAKVANKQKMEDEESSVRINNFLNLMIKQTTDNEALLGLIVDSLISEISTKPRKVPLVMDFI